MGKLADAYNDCKSEIEKKNILTQLVNLPPFRVGGIDIKVQTENQGGKSDYRICHTHVYLMKNEHVYEEFELTVNGEFVSLHSESRVQEVLGGSGQRKSKQGAYAALAKYALVFHWLWKKRNEVNIDCCRVVKELKGRVITHSYRDIDFKKWEKLCDKKIKDLYDDALFILIDCGEIDPKNPFPNLRSGE